MSTMCYCCSSVSNIVLWDEPVFVYCCKGSYLLFELRQHKQGCIVILLSGCCCCCCCLLLLCEKCTMRMTNTCQQGVDKLSPLAEKKITNFTSGGFSFTLRMTYDNRQLRDSQIRESKNINRKNGKKCCQQALDKQRAVFSVEKAIVRCHGRITKKKKRPLAKDFDPQL